MAVRCQISGVNRRSGYCLVNDMASDVREADIHEVRSSAKPGTEVRPYVLDSVRQVAQPEEQALMAIREAPRKLEVREV